MNQPNKETSLPTFNGDVTGGPGGTAFVGPDATLLFAAISLRTSMKLYMRTGMQMSRMHTPKRMREAAQRITNKGAYKPSKIGMALALGDLEDYINRQKALLELKNTETQGNA